MNATVVIITGIQTKPRPRFVNRGKFVQTYTPKTALNYERYIASEYQRLGGKYYGDKPLYVSIVFMFKTPENWPKYKKWAVEKHQTACTKHKDLDNLAKSVLDALNTIAYDDDKQIVELNCCKLWTNDQERIIINIYDIKHPNDLELKEKWKKEQKNGK